MAILTESKTYIDGVSFVLGQDITDTQDTAINANNNSATAISQSETALSNSESAVNTANEALSRVTESTGTAVNVAGETVASLEFTSDPQTQINSVEENKADKDLSNVTYPANTVGSTTTGAGDRVIETYISDDGKTWYRKWASDWKEYGIFNYTTSGNGSKTINLPSGFFDSTATYSVYMNMGANLSSSTSNVTDRQVFCQRVSATQIRFYYFNECAPYSFYMCGY